MTFEDFSESTDAWYILYDNGHQGPFTFEKILALHQLGEIGAENLLWNSSLTKWEKITEIPELKDLPPTAVTYKSNFSEELVWLKRTPTTWVESYIEDDLSVNTAIVIQEAAAPQETVNVITAEPIVRASNSLKPYLLGLAITAVTLILLTAGTYIFYGRMFPFKSLPVSKTDQEAMKNAVGQPLSQGVTAQPALVLGSKYGPAFFIATNLPNETNLTLLLRGHRETLVGKLFFEWNTSMKVNQNLAKTPVITEKNGIGVPAGVYDLFIYNGNEIVSTTSILLGGLSEDVYHQQLLSYHQSLQGQARTELIEIVQLADTLELQLNDTQTRYDFLGRRRYPIAWGKFHKEWTQLDSQLQNMFKPWTRSYSLQNFYFHNLYSQLVGLETLLSEIHRVQHAAVLSRKHDVAIDNNVIVARSMLREIRNFISTTK